MQVIEKQAFAISEVATALGMSEPSVRKQIKLGNLETVRVGGRVLITQPAIDKLLGKPAG